MTSELAGRRLGVLALVAFAMFAALAGRLYFLQVMTPERFEAEVAGNRVREVYTEAPRGRILDRDGEVLAGRRQSLVVTIDWTTLRELAADTRAEVFEDVAMELSDAGIKVKASRIDTQYQRAIDVSVKPTVIADDVGEELWVRIAEAGLPGVDVERRWVRTYPYGSIAAHILGYTGTVRDPERAEALNAESDKVYFPGDQIGVAGLEQTYEDVLRGTPELRRVEVDAQNRVVRTIEVVQEAIPGSDVMLSLDIDLQYAAEQILIDELANARAREPEGNNALPQVADGGSLVAINVDGSIVAMASAPTFDPRDFIFGISNDLWTELSERSDLPLLDRAVRNSYPPGSTFKPFPAIAALESGARDQYTTWNDQGVYTLTSCTDPSNRDAGCTKRNAGGAVLGPVQLREAIERSSDTYFYSLGELFWVQQDLYGRTAIQDTAERFGFGLRPGIDLPSQTAGLMPTPEQRLETWGEDARWYPGDNTNIAIGQGEVQVSPLQLANAYAMLANGGTRYQPRLGASISNPDGTVTIIEPVVVADEPLDPTHLAALNDGMAAVVDSSLGTGRGTAVRAFRGYPHANFRVIGKTGTAQVVRKADFALFASYAPFPNPEYAVVAILEQAGFGGDAAAPAVRRFYEMLFGITPTPTAPLAEDRNLDVAGLTDFDLSFTLPEVFIDPEQFTAAPAAADPPPDAGAPAPTAPPVTTTTTTTAPQSTETSSVETTEVSETTSSSSDGQTTTTVAETTAPVDSTGTSDPAGSEP
jgi:penicillin-binding protein 2